jgi:hypothetical protein
MVKKKDEMLTSLYSSVWKTAGIPTEKDALLLTL